TPQLVPGCRKRYDRIPGGVPQALADPVEKPQPQRAWNREDEYIEWPRQDGQRIAGYHQRLSRLQLVRKISGIDLEDIGGRFRDPIDESERCGAGPQHGGKKRRKNRVDHFRRKIVEQAGEAQQEYIARQTENPFPHPGPALFTAWGAYHLAGRPGHCQGAAPAAGSWAGPSKAILERGAGLV